MFLPGTMHEVHITPGHPPVPWVHSGMDFTSPLA